LKALAVAALMTCLISVPVWADCIAPEPPLHLPDGATASREDMVSAMQAIRDYEAAVKAFSRCADQSNSAALLQAADRAVDKVRAIADKFNVELYAFKKRNIT
jgi:hypothetical protein